jgi:hypothetical protein
MMAPIDPNQQLNPKKEKSRAENVEKKRAE